MWCEIQSAYFTAPCAPHPPPPPPQAGQRSVKSSWRGGERGAAYPQSEGVGGVSAARVSVHRLVHIRGAISTGDERAAARSREGFCIESNPSVSALAAPDGGGGGYRIQGRVCHPQKGVRGGSERREGMPFRCSPRLMARSGAWERPWLGRESGPDRAGEISQSVNRLSSALGEVNSGTMRPCHGGAQP